MDINQEHGGNEEDKRRSYKECCRLDFFSKFWGEEKISGIY
jgi:hypothetical protein